MHTSSKLACVALLLILGISLGFGWGSATHVYFANYLGVKLGPLNQNEIYGATLPDIFGYDFTTQGFVADYYLHTSKDLLWGLYAGASSREAKAGFYGSFTHNNINDPAFSRMRGADWYAHGKYPFPGEMPDQDGWVIHQGFILIQNEELSSYIVGLVGVERAQIFLPVVGHTLIETAGDILLRRCEDPLVGARLILAARNRSGEIPTVLAGALQANGLYPYDDAVAAEAVWKESMLLYGQLFLLPEPQLIAVISEQTAAIASSFMRDVLEMQDPPPVEPTVIAGFIKMAMDQIKPLLHSELMATLGRLERNMRFGPPPAGPIFAFWKDGLDEEALAEFRTPVLPPAEFALDQNYPNPFNPTTSIAYAVPSDSRVTLKVYNSIGQEVATLVNDDMPAGRYVATWNAEGVASGTYFYRIQAGNTVITKKMTLLR
jgi:hypothetical protein